MPKGKNKKNLKKKFAKIRKKDLFGVNKQNKLKKKSRSLKKKNTEPEKKMYSILSKIGIYFETEKIVGNKIFDFFIPSINLLIEVDGDYWHGNPDKYNKKEYNKIQKRNRRNDKYKNSIAKVNGFELKRFWENDLLNSEQKILNEISNDITNDQVIR